MAVLFYAKVQADGERKGGMMMRAGKLGMWFLVGILSLPAMGCEKTGNGQKEDKAGMETRGDAKTGTWDTEGSGGEAAADKGDAISMKDGQEAGLGEEIPQDGCIWTVSSMELTKSLGRRSKDDINYWGEETDDPGNLIGAQSYLFVTVSCKNSSGSTKEVLLNSNSLVAMDGTGQLLETGSEARYISKKQDGNGSSEKAFHYVLEDGEETGLIEIGYILEDSAFDSGNKLYYCVGTQGSQLGNPENRYIEVERAQ